MAARRRVTLSDVAADAGVSRATASLVLRGEGRVAAGTRERVLRSMQRLGYVYHRGAASLRLDRSGAVGLLVTDVSHPFFGEMAIGFEEVLELSGVVTLLGNTFDSERRQHKLVRSLNEFKIDGLVVVPALGSGAQLLGQLQASGVSYLLATRPLPGVGAPYIGPDDVEGGRIAARHLIDHGCGSLMYLGGVPEAVPHAERVAGYREAVAEAGAADLGVMAGPVDAAGGYALGLGLLKRRSVLPEGVICHSDSVALGLYRALRDHAPGQVDQVRVVGFDGSADAAFWEPPLTSVSADPRRLGARAAELLLELVGGVPPGSVVRVRPELAVGRSCGCGPS
ncbi:LacI family DNA-binding transcriptional regulator [Streptomyces sp. NPDC056405]|uniref:LacI family DNA-binding transcriptional regulator n=1 Tax=Streptomyces sp. NPDC056405 TaxID=3345811 RepID=UPI0035DBD813